MSDALLVLGMHRSGTSTVAGVLSKLGAVAPRNLMAANSTNPKGFFESSTVMALNDEILESAGSRWNDWRAVNPDWASSPVSLDFRQRACRVLTEDFDSAPLWVLKDPRICRLAPFWFDVLREMNVTPRVLIPFRSPFDVAQSLASIHGLSIRHGVLLWLRHVLDAERDSREISRSIFAWRDFRKNWRSALRKAGEEIDVRWPRMSDRAAAEVRQFLSSEFVHYETDDNTLAELDGVNDWALRAYFALQELAKNPNSNSAMAELDEVRQLFEQAVGVFGELLADHELNLDGVRTLLGQANHDRDLARSQNDQLVTEKANFLSEVQSLRAEAAAQNEAFQNERSARDAALAAETWARAAAEEARNTALHELDVLRGEQAARFERYEQELTTARAEAEEARIVALRELQTLRAEFASSTTEYERALSDRNALIAAATTDMELLRSKLDVVESDRVHLAHQLDRLFAERDALQADNAYLLETLKALQNRKAEHEAMIAHWRERAEVAESESAVVRKELAEAVSAVSEAKALNKETEAALQHSLLQNQIQANEQANRLTETQHIYEAQVKALRAEIINGDAARANLQRAASGGTLLGGLVSLKSRRLREARYLLGTGLFDADYYRSCYRVELANVGQGDLAAALHYVEEGFAKGLRPNLMFDSHWYLDCYPDVRRDGINPLFHYHSYGWKEGRDPSAEFQTRYYLKENTDVQIAKIDPLLHYLLHGRYEGRKPRPDV